MSSPLPRLRSTEGKLRLRGTEGPAALLLPGHKPASAFQEPPPVPSLTGQAARPGHSQAPDQARPLSAAFCFSFLVCFFSKEVKLQRLLAAKAAWTGAAASWPWGEGAAGQGRAREARPSLPTPHSPLPTRDSGEDVSARPPWSAAGWTAPGSHGSPAPGRGAWWTRPGPDRRCPLMLRANRPGGSVRGGPRWREHLVALSVSGWSPDKACSRGQGPRTGRVLELAPEPAWGRRGCRPLTLAMGSCV